MFNLAMTEQRNALGEYHINVSEMLAKITDSQLETRKLIDAMSDFEEALRTQQIVNRQDNSKILEI